MNSVRSLSAMGLLCLLSLILGGCGLLGSREPAPVEPRKSDSSAVSPGLTLPVPPKPPRRGGGYYLDDGPGDNPPPDLAAIPDATPSQEALHRFANKPYNVFGKDYVPMAADAPYQARGVASWYGRKFHGQKTSSGEPYDMYGMTAAHPTLPIPSYVRVSNPANGRSVVLRVNDRGPFHSNRLIDLSYTAAWKLGYVENGSTLVEVEKLQPGLSTLASTRNNLPPVATGPAGAAPPLPLQREASGTYLQLGAFGSRDNAETFLAHLSRELDRSSDSAPLAGKLIVRSAGVWHKVQLGPWANVTDARAAADSLNRLLGTTPLIVSN